MVREYEAGVLTSVLSKKYGLDQSWLATILRRSGAKMRSSGGVVRAVPKRTEQRILKLWAAGEPVFGIQEKTGIHVGRVKRVLTEAGIVIERRPMSGARHPSWRGGRYVDDGYVYIQLADDSPLASMRDQRGYVLEHRLVVAKKLGRPLTAQETVHHINGNGEDNRPENLQLRRGRHGKHQCLRCADCGSTNIEAIPIAEGTKRGSRKNIS